MLNDPKKHWKDMPSFNQGDRKAFGRVTINFESQEDMDDFNKLTGLSVTKKTKGAFYPKPNPIKTEYVSESHE